MFAFVLVLVAISGGSWTVEPDVEVRVGLSGSAEVDLAEVVDRLARASGLTVEIPPGKVNLPLEGRSANLTRTMLSETLGPDATLEVGPRELIIRLAPRLLDADHRADWEQRIRNLSRRASKEVERRSRYGFHALASFRPNDPRRPTVCLIHGLNSTSSVFKHMVEPLETAGYGIVVYDFPYNRDLDETSAAFARDWAEFRRKWSETRPWSVVAHSMGSLLARYYVEDEHGRFAADITSLILIAPPNQGSGLSRAQTVLQTVQSVQALNGSKRTDPLALLGDGLGLAADDMTPGSAYLNTLNSHPRRNGVRYHILAGDVGYLSVETRRQIDARSSGKGLLGGIGRIVASGVSSQLDEITDGLGDGCVAVASTRLGGVDAPLVLHANHLELIRAPLLFPEPGPVVTMPEILKWLSADRAIDPPSR